MKVADNPVVARSGSGSKIPPESHRFLMLLPTSVVEWRVISLPGGVS